MRLLSLFGLLVLIGCGSPETVTRKEAEEAAREAMESSQRDAEAPSTSTASVNTECPVMGGPTDPERTLIFENQKVSFCCQRCTLEWLQYTDEQRREALARASGDG